MTEASATIDEEKLAAARRRLSAAIRMFFGREDDLAIQTVASAAYEALNDLRKILRKDAGAEFDLKNAGTLPLLMLAHSAYIDVTSDSIWPEGVILWVYFNTVEGTKDAVQEEFKEFVDALDRLGPNQRLHFCSVWVEKLKQTGTADSNSIH